MIGLLPIYTMGVDFRDASSLIKVSEQPDSKSAFILIGF
jgi:hypothetical protein